MSDVRNRRGLVSYDFKGESVADDIRTKYGYDGDFLQIYAENKGTVVHKWHHYLPLYDRYFSPYRRSNIRFLEIGVSEGGSLHMWRSYFGAEATIFGVDINPNCAQFDGVAGQVRIGSQADPAFLAAVVAEMGGVDVVLDDGSHHMDHVRASLKTLFPLLSIGGLYMIEDLHTAYWRSYGGSFTGKENFFSDLKTMIDDMHHWYHPGEISNPDLAASMAGLHVHDSIVVIDKQPVYPPAQSKVGLSTKTKPAA